MELQTISQISKTFNLSTRALRYYEQIGLITSEKKEDYAYRVYSEDTVKRLQQIIILRKLRIPLKQISDILNSENTAEIIDAFRQNLSEVDEEITALSTIRDIINNFINRLNENVHGEIKLNLLDDTDLLEAVDSLTIQKATLTEEKIANDLQMASEKLNKLTDKDVRIIYLPPMTVAAVHCFSDTPENDSAKLMKAFVDENQLCTIKPDIRSFGFKNPDSNETEYHGYELWITIPDEMKVDSPFEKKQFGGGLYAGHCITFGDFDEWKYFFDWIESNEKYAYEAREPSSMEEVLSIYTMYKYGQWHNQLDLLIPIKPKEEE